MIALLEFAILVWGVTYVVTQSALLTPARIALVAGARIASVGFAILVVELVYCRACVGFWAGVVLSLVGIAPFEGAPWVWPAVESGFTACGMMALVTEHVVPSNAFQIEQGDFYDEKTES
jgi:hypothetical protein